MNKKLSIFTKLFVVSFFITLLFSCSFLENLYNDNSTEQDNDIAYLTLYDTSIARDIFPSEDDLDKTKLTNLTLKGKWQNGAEQTLIEEQTTWTAFIDKFPFAVQTGLWDFTLTAKLNGVDFIGEITKKEISKAGSTTPLEFTLETEAETCGGLSLTINVQNYSTAIPSGTTLTINTTLTNSSNEIKYNESKTYSGSSVTFESTIESKQLEAGVYDLEISLTVNGISQPITKHSGENVYIYAGIITTSLLNLYVSPVYDIAYEYHDGELVTTGTTVPAKFSRKATVANLPELKKTGYNFLGWFTDDTDGTEVTEVSMSTINTSATTTTYYARFQTISYKITLENMTGASSDEIPANYNIESATITLPTPSKPGYNFEGWYTNEGLTTAAPESIPTGSTGDKTFYAKWTARTDTVYIVKHWKHKQNKSQATHDSSCFNLDDTEFKTGTTDGPVSFTLKETSSTDPTNPYYGFNTPTEEEIAAAQALTISGDGTLEVNLYYERQIVTVLYKEDATTIFQTDETHYYGTTTSIITSEPTRENYIFKGWSLKPEASDTDRILKINTDYTIYTISDIEPITFYAQWKPITYTVSFNTNGGSAIEAQTVQKGNMAEAPENPPTKEKYGFTGWYEDKQLTHLFDFSNTPITSNKTLYAGWQIHYAKLNDTYYDTYGEIKEAFTALPVTSEITVTFYSASANDIGNYATQGSMIYAAQESKAERVNFIIQEDANIAFGANNEAAFAGCTKFVSIDLRGVKSATTLKYMFKACTNLQSVTFADDFDTSIIQNMEQVFSGCSSLTEVDISSFNTSSVETTHAMFYNCSNLTTIYASSSFALSDGTVSTMMFDGCTSLVGGIGTTYNNKNVDKTYARIDERDAPGYFTFKAPSSSVTVTFNTMGGSAVASQTLASGSYAARPKTPLKDKFVFDGWYTDTDYNNPFDITATPIVSDITLYAKWELNTHYAKIDGTFYDSYGDAKDVVNTLSAGEHTVIFYSIPADDLGSTSYPGSMIYGIMQSQATAVHLIIHETANIDLGTNNEATFYNGDKFVSIDLSGVKRANFLGSMFSHCSNLQSVTFADDFDTSYVEDMREMFSGCTMLTEVDLTSFKTNKVKYSAAMFLGCSSLTTIYASSSFIIPSSVTSADMFAGCNSLVGGNGTKFIEAKISNGEYARLDTASTPGYFSKKSTNSSSLICSVGDIILRDGTVIPYTDGLKLTQEQSESAIAVIFYDGTGYLGTKPLGVGLYQTNNKIMINAKAAGYGTYLNSDDYSGKVFTQAVYNCSDYTDKDAAEAYPVFNWLRNYYKVAGGVLDGTNYNDDWYLPGRNELMEINQNLDFINTVIAIINNKNANIFETGAPYLAAYQCPSKENFSAIFQTRKGTWTEDSKDVEGPFACAIHEF